jgi:predicted lactoylglutathione lyase
MGENAEGGAKKEAGGLLIVQSKVRDLIREKEKRTSDDFITALSEHVRQAVEKAIARATANGRSTLRPEDL